MLQTESLELVLSQIHLNKKESRLCYTRGMKGQQTHGCRVQMLRGIEYLKKSETSNSHLLKLRENESLYN